MKTKVTIFWFRRDLRLVDNVGLSEACDSSDNVLPIFIFDTNITDNLKADDPRLTFIHQQLSKINQTLKTHGSSLKIFQGKPVEVWIEILNTFEVDTVYFNRDYEPFARERDALVYKLLQEHGIGLKTAKDSVIHEKKDVLKNDGLPYTVFTPYKNKWLQTLGEVTLKPPLQWNSFFQKQFKFPALEKLGFQQSKIVVQDFQIESLQTYGETRDFPALDSTSYLGPHLRFGTVSVREIFLATIHINAVFVSELIWREFFSQIMFHFPQVQTQNFRPKYNEIEWENNEDDFAKWCQGQTGFPLVDAGMRQLNQTGYMHNRVRMVCAGFLCKHLLIDWQWGEKYFAEKLLDFDLASNNGNWQWAAGTGCDAAPYFRIFNPIEQLKKFDKNLEYVKQWIPELGGFDYPQPMVDHKAARLRALERYKLGIENYTE